MDFLQNIDAGSAVLIALGLGVVCVIGVILLLAVNILGGAFGIVGNLLGGITGLLGGITSNPVSCCGCFALLGVIAVCGASIFGISQLFSGCGTVDATNFCSFFGR